MNLQIAYWMITSANWLAKFNFSTFYLIDVHPLRQRIDYDLNQICSRLLGHNTRCCTHPRIHVFTYNTPKPQPVPNLVYRSRKLIAMTFYGKPRVATFIFDLKMYTPYHKSTVKRAVSFLLSWDSNSI